MTFSFPSSEFPSWEVASWEVVCPPRGFCCFEGIRLVGLFAGLRVIKSTLLRKLLGTSLPRARSE